METGVAINSSRRERLADSESNLAVERVAGSRTARAEMAPATKIEYLYMSYLRNSRPVSESELNQFGIRLIRLTLRFLAIVARIDVCGKCKVLEPEQQQQQQALRQTFLGIEMFHQSRWWTRQGRSWLSNLILALYLLFSAHLLTNLVYQYAYDFDKLRVARLRALVRQQLVSSSDFARLSMIFLERADESRSLLRIIGAPHRHISIAIECLYVYFVVFGLIMYCISFLYYRLVTPYDFHFVRELLDFDDEWRHSNSLIQREVSSFLLSDRIFLDRELGEPKWQRREQWAGLRALPAAGSLAGSAFRPRTRAARKRGRWQELTGNEYRVYELLMHMLASGALLPCNKSAQWVGKRIEITYLALAGMLLFTIAFATTMMGVSFYQRDKTQLLGPSELAILSSTVGLISIIGLSSTLTASTFFIGALDQLVMVNKMHELIGACAHQNSAHLAALLHLESAGCALHGLAGRMCDVASSAPSHPSAETSSSSSSSSSTKAEQAQLECGCVDAMNANLLFVFLQYKIFIGQHGPSRKTFQSVIFFAIALILLIPIIIKLHIPYLNLSNYNNAKLFAVSVSPLILLPANAVLLPVCHLDAQFSKLFRTWSSLIAHIIEAESHPVGRGLYDRHAVSLLQKEICHSFQFDERRRSGLHAATSTYTTLVKAHFWFGLAVLAIMSDDLPTGHTSLAMSDSLFTDPFGIFSRPKFLGI